ncbi:SusE domain-containing protein [Galbibacter sp. PAP.153]|uniref:SusE domain-containing protein n=1 Tax=Galbibacter sp. PAP.153 TaxID=3104623 RepID=UPI00300B4282
MKKTTYLFVIIVASISFYACSSDDDFTFIAKPDPDGIAFENTFLDAYSLNAENGDNLAERFIWNAVDFDAPTPIKYELQAAITESFESIDALANDITETNYGVTVKNMLDLATDAGLDNDPETEAPNTGTLYFRVRAYVGDDAANTVEQLSEAVPINVVLVEANDNDNTNDLLTTWGVVGDAAPNGWDGPDAPFIKTDDPDVIVAYVNLTDGEIKFRENNDWASNYGDTGADGTLEDAGDNIKVTAGSYKIAFNTNELTYSLEPYSWGLVGDATPNGWDGPDAPLTFDAATNTWNATTTLTDGEIKFRLNNDWGVNFGDNGTDGTIDNGGDNIPVTAGNYNITVNFDTLEYSLEAL